MQEALFPDIYTGAALFGGARLGEPLSNVVEELPVRSPAHYRTADARWANCLELAASPDMPRGTGTFALCIGLEVHTGAIGVAIVSDGAPGIEWWLDTPCAPVTVVLPVTEPDKFEGIVIRNFADTGASEFSVHYVAAYALDLSADGAFIGFHDTRSSGLEVEVEQAFAADGFALLRNKWSEIPSHHLTRITSTYLNSLSDAELMEFYDGLENRGVRAYDDGTRISSIWPYGLYLDIFRGKRVLDVGSGCGYDAIWFGSNGIDWTCIDIVPGNIENINRMAALRALSIRGQYIEDFSSFDVLGQFDVIWCNGSMINAPFSFAARESQKLLEHLRIGGRWIELGYPKERWRREGCLPLHRWGERTDGLGTPWMDWYDTEKMLRRLQPAEFDVYLAYEFENNNFNWFDLVRVG